MERAYQFFVGEIALLIDGLGHVIFYLMAASKVSTLTQFF
jgi:hypothetical protein